MLLEIKAHADGLSSNYAKEVSRAITNVMDSVKYYELDFNVSGYRKPYCNEAYIDGYLLKLVRDYNVKTILGSDSHTHDTVGYKMKEYNRLMEELQF